MTEARYIRADASLENVARMTYDSVGNMTRVTDTNVDIEQDFDALNRITAINHAHLQKIQRQGWDAAGNRTWMSVDGIPNSTATYEWDSRNRLNAIHHASMGDVAYSYNAAGQKTTLTYPNGIVCSYQYDTNGRLTQLSYQAPGQNPVFAEDLTYDARGNITQRIDDEGTHAYQYDWLDQLTRAQYPDSTFEEFAYDKSGNRSSLTTAGGVATYAVDDADQLLSVSGPGQSEITTFGWTPNGEMASELTSAEILYCH
ncbi:MAG: RHS repeat protein [Candidatus Wallbacteria bacterium]|nr:RHS repeat protein [Candidatus Wallbacteria bacterium]